MLRAFPIRLAAVLPLVVLANCHAIGPPELTLPAKPVSMQEIEASLNQAVADKAPPGLTLAVIKGQETRYLKSFGIADGPRNLPATEQTVYQWWSITKLFTATAVLQLQERGRLSIDDPVVKHLPFVTFRGKVTHDSTITIRHLLSHSAGLGDIGIGILGWIHFDGDAPFNQTELLKNKLGTYNKVKVAPGVEGRYSNFGYLMLAAVIEAASGQSYEDYIRSQILTPLGMTRTDFSYTPLMRETEAAGSHPRDFISYLVPIYVDMDRAVREKVDGTFWFNRVYSNQQGATGLIGSTEDLVKFIKAIMPADADTANTTPRILSAGSVALMQQPLVAITKSPAPTKDPMQFGLGWFIGRNGDNVTLSHGGTGMGFVAMVQITRHDNRSDDVAVIAVANSTYLGKTMGLDLVEKVRTLNW